MQISLSECIYSLGEVAWCSYCNASSDSSWSVPLAWSSARRRCWHGSGLNWPALHPGPLSIGEPEKDRDFLLVLKVEKRPRKFSVCHPSQIHAHVNGRAHSLTLLKTFFFISVALIEFFPPQILLGLVSPVLTQFLHQSFGLEQAELTASQARVYWGQCWSSPSLLIELKMKSCPPGHKYSSKSLPRSQYIPQQENSRKHQHRTGRSTVKKKKINGKMLASSSGFSSLIRCLEPG